MYESPRFYICVDSQPDSGSLKLRFDCDPANTTTPAYAVLRAERSRSGDDVFCVGRSAKIGDRIERGSNCSRFESAESWLHVGAFAVPVDSAGPSWCLGKFLPDPHADS